MANRQGNNGNSDRLYFPSWAPKSLWDGDCSQAFAPWKKSHDKPGECIKKQGHYFVDKSPSSQSYGFSSYHVWMWELDHKEGWAQNWCFRTVVLKKTLENPVNCKEIKSVNPKGNQPWIFTGRDWCWSWSSNPLATWCAEPIHWKRPWCWERQKAGKEGVTKDEMVGWHHWLNAHEFKQAPGDGEGQVHGVAECQTWLSNPTTTTTDDIVPRKQNRGETRKEFPARKWEQIPGPEQTQ